MGLTEDLSRKDTLLETLEKTLEESRRLRSQILGAGAAPGRDADEVNGDFCRTVAPALSWPVPL